MDFRYGIGNVNKQPNIEAKPAHSGIKIWSWFWYEESVSHIFSGICIYRQNIYQFFQQTSMINRWLFNINSLQVTKRFPHGVRHFQKIYSGFWKIGSKNPNNLYHANWLKRILRSFSKFTSGLKKFQKLLWVHRPSKPTTNFLEMPTPMRESLCHLVRIDVNLNLLEIYI